MIHLITGNDKDKAVDIHRVGPRIKERSRIGLLNNGMTIEELNLSEQATYTETQADGSTINWVLPHKKAFPQFINTHFGENAKYISDSTVFLQKIAESTDESPPFAYQLLIRDYLRFGTPYRSLLLEHGLGSGKTRSAIMVAETFREQGLPTLILTPAFLHLNFMDEIHKWAGEDIRITSETTPDETRRRQALINDSYFFVHYNATGNSVGAKSPSGEDIGGKGGVFEQLARLGIGFPPDSKYGKLFPYLNQRYGPLKPPSNMLIIIEEVHNLNRTFTAGTQKSQLKFFLYPLLMMASDCKIIALSGTPIISLPFEMATLYSLLRGPIPTDGAAAGGAEHAYALPQAEDKFNSTFVRNNKIINSELLMSRIVGLSSLFKGISDDKERIIFPAGKDSPIDRNLEMSKYQSDAMYLALAAELKPSAARQLVDLAGKHALPYARAGVDEPDPSYHMNSRQISNFAFPPEVPRPRPRARLIYDQTPLATYVMEFSVGPDKIYQTLKANNVDTSKIEAAYNTATDDSVKRQLMSDLFKEAYPKLPRDTSAIWQMLSPRDQHELKRYMGTYQERLHAAIKQLADEPEKYFTMKNLKKYSVKMVDIYRNIVGDLTHGAPHLIPDQSHIQQQEQQIEQEDEYEVSTMDPDGQDDDEALGEFQEQDMEDESVHFIDDPDDELMKHMDVFKTDEELEAMGMRVTGGPALVYSFFNNVEGAGIFSKVLEAHRFEQFIDKTWDGHSPIDQLNRAPRYAFIKGGMNVNLKVKIMRVFNSPANRHGQLIRVVFVTQAAGEGISLYHLRQIHIMEPYWNNVIIEQVIGRGFRLRSHRYLSDPREREIQVYHYYANRSRETSDDYLMSLGVPNEMPSIDQHIKTMADKKSELTSQLKLLRGAAAIDCKINRDYNNLGIKCFDFRGNESGDAYTADIVVQKEAPVTKTVQTAITYSHFEFNGKVYVAYPTERVRLQITIPGKGVVKKEAGVAYEPPTGWLVGNPIDIHDFKKYGYIIGTEESKKLMPLNPNIKEF